MTAPASGAPDVSESGTAPPAEPTTTGTPATDRNEEVASLNAENAKWRRQLREAQTELDRIRQASATDAEKAVMAARAEGAAEYQTKWKRALVQNAALAVLAERGVTATEPALRSLDLDDIDIDEVGKFDRTAIMARVDELLNRYPMFGPQGPPSGAPPLPTLSGDGQRRLSTETQVRPSGKLSDADAEAYLRYGMGGR